MKRFAFVVFVFAFAFTVCCVNGLYSHECREAETSSDKLVRFIENANCTLAEGHRRLAQKLNWIQEHFKRKLDFFAQKIATSRPNDNEKHDEELNERPSTTFSSTTSYPVFNDPRKQNPTTTRRVPPTTSQPQTSLSGFDDRGDENPSISLPLDSLPGYEGLDHPIDIRMIFGDTANRPYSRSKRDANEEATENENQGKNFFE